MKNDKPNLKKNNNKGDHSMEIIIFAGQGYPL